MTYGRDYWQTANEKVVRFAMIETAQALDNLEGILQVEGLGAVYIGPSGLSLSVGCAPQFDELDPPVQQVIEHILKRAHAYGVKAGIHCVSPRAARRRTKRGYDLVTSMSDMRMLQEGCKAVQAEWEGVPSDASSQSVY